MADAYVGEIRMFGGNFAPQNFRFCDGQMLAISQYTALFQLIGTTYGGDGQQTFALPDFRGRAPLHQGSGFAIGEAAGTEKATVSVAELPAHGHLIMAANSATSRSPENMLPARGDTDLYAAPSGNPTYLDNGAMAPAGSSQPHDNMQPYACVNFIICVAGIFPSRS